MTTPVLKSLVRGCARTLEHAVGLGDTRQVRECARMIRECGSRYGITRLVILADTLEGSALSCNLSVSLACLESIRAFAGVDIGPALCRSTEYSRIAHHALDLSSTSPAVGRPRPAH